MYCLQSKIRTLAKHLSAGKGQPLRPRISGCRRLSVYTPAPRPLDQLCERMVPFRTNSPQDGFAWTSPFGQITVPGLRVEEYVWKNLAKWHDKTAIVCGITGRQYTYGKLRDHSAAVAYRLRSNFNLKSGDVVAISMPNVPEYAIVVLGALEAGLTITTINPSYTPDEQARQLAMTNAKLIFCLDEDVDKVLQAGKLNSKSIPVVATKVDKRRSIPDGVIDLSLLTDPAGVDYTKYNATVHSDQDLCVLPFSSGTTGMPKGVMINHSQLTANMEIMNAPNPHHSITQPTTKYYQDVIHCVLPFFHMYGFAFMLISKLSLGCKLVTLPRFDQFSYFSSVAEHKVTILPLVPPILQILTNDDRCTKQHFAHVRTIICAGAAIGANTFHRFQSRARHIEILQAFGMTESAGVIFMNPSLYHNYASIGWVAASTEAKVVSLDDPLNRGLDANIQGELLVRGPSILLGYLNNPKETAKVLSKDGWLRTGDIGMYDNNGDFYITDRAKDIIKVQAFQVAPAELEDILLSHPDVLDVAIIGIKHDKFGEVPKAFVVARKDAKLTATEVQEYIEKRCVKYKWLLGGVEFITEVPKSKTGKILRRELKVKYEE